MRISLCRLPVLTDFVVALMVTSSAWSEAPVLPTGIRLMISLLDRTPMTLMGGR